MSEHCTRCDGKATLYVPVLTHHGEWYRGSFACHSCRSGLELATPTCTAPACDGGELCGGIGHHRIPPLPTLRDYTDQTCRRTAVTVTADFVRILDVAGLYWLWHAVLMAQEEAETTGSVPKWFVDRMANRKAFDGPGPDTWTGGSYRRHLERALGSGAGGELPF